MLSGKVPAIFSFIRGTEPKVQVYYSCWEARLSYLTSTYIEGILPESLKIADILTCYDHLLFHPSVRDVPGAALSAIRDRG